MAHGIRWKCSRCGYSLEGWSDGHMYIRDDKGKKHRLYHPCEMDCINRIVSESAIGSRLTGDERDAFIRSRIGCRDDFLCPDCGRHFQREAAATPPPCPRCASTATRSRYDLGGVT